MNIKSFMMDNSDLVNAIRMFSASNWTSGIYTLMNIDTIIFDYGETLKNYFHNTIHADISDDVIWNCMQFYEYQDDNWLVYVYYTEGQFLGIVAFNDWR